MQESLEPEPPRSPEQLEAIRRRSTILAACGGITAIIGLILLLSRTVNFETPPAIVGVYMSFCAIMMAVGILFYVKGTPRNRPAVIASIFGLLIGIAGTGVFVRQTILWHAAVEEREFQNVHTIAQEALKYARSHDGNYPPHLLDLLRTKQITLQTIRTPLGSDLRPIHMQLMTMQLNMLDNFDRIESQSDAALAIAKFQTTALLTLEIDSRADYQYFGAGLKLPSLTKSLPEEIILVTSKNAIKGKQLSIGYVNGEAEFLFREAAETALRQSNDARQSEGFPPIRPPGVIHRAQKQERQDSARE
jgi:hypothetical protein